MVHRFQENANRNLQDYKINEIKNEILLTSQRKEMIDSSLDIKKEQNENKNERHQDSSKIAISPTVQRNVNEKETYPRLTDHWMAENITDKPSTG